MSLYFPHTWWSYKKKIPSFSFRNVLKFYLKILGSLFIYFFFFWWVEKNPHKNSTTFLSTTFFTNDLELNRLRETFFLWGNVPSYQENWLKQLQCHQNFWCLTSLFLLIIVQISNQLTIINKIYKKNPKKARLHEVDMIWNIL